jgi:hypothetical protein
MNLGDKRLFIYNVDKESEILPLNYEGISEFISTLDKLGGRKSFSSALIYFDGYNDVTDELHEIIEVRKYVKGLFDRFPHLLYYINFELEGHHVLLSSLLDFQSVSVGERLTPIQLTEKYGFDHANIPKNNVFLRMPNDLLRHMEESILAHAKMMKRERLGQKLVYRLTNMFKRGVE